MSDQPPPPGADASGDPRADRHPVAELRGRGLQWIWAIPIVALLIGGWIGFNAWNQRGPLVTITFLSADGLQAGQTKVSHKAVQLGTVQSIDLSPDMSHVIVRVRMRREAEPELTSTARFWVVRPRLTLGNISGLDTLISGSYIEMDPGSRGGKAQTSFTGLEEPPAVRSDDPGKSFRLTADRIGTLSSGSPVFFRDIPVGEVLGYDLSPNGNQVSINLFVRAPYDKFVHTTTRFWNASGVSIELGAQGVRVQLQSLAAAVSGGVAFDTPTAATSSAATSSGATPTGATPTGATPTGATPTAAAAVAAAGPPSPANSVFHLYPDEATMLADNASQRIPMITYFEGSVRGLAVGAPVDLYGIQIGSVTSVQLQFSAASPALPRVAVRFEVNPDSLRDTTPIDERPDPLTIAQQLVRQGMRVGLATSNFLTGQLLVQLQFVPNAPPAEARLDDGLIVLPSQAGGLDSITAGLSDIVQKLEAVPFDQIGANLNTTLQSVNGVVNGPQLQQTLRSLAASMNSVNDFVTNLNRNATPALNRLPQISRSLQQSLDRANQLLGAYGQDSQFNRDLQRLLDQVSDTARSVRLLSDYLDQHPEALLRGRAPDNGGK